MFFIQKIIKILAIYLLITLMNISPLYAGTLDEVKARGFLKCGIAEEFLGFASPNDEGNWEGFDVDLCKAIAVAIFNDDKKINFIPTNTKSRFPLLALGEIDVLIRNTTWSYSRDVNLEFDFVGINFFDGQTFMVPKSLNI